MSNVYVTEPATIGRIILETTHGPLDISLWSRECPQTTRLFVQLCLDGFYDKMVFHRIVPNLLLQTGAIRYGTPQTNHAMEQSNSGTNNKNDTTAIRQLHAYQTFIGAAEALERRRHETNARIRFNHRGQVAMAMTISQDDHDKDFEIQPQFFITTEPAEYLDGQHVIFGTLGSGPTIFNAIRIASTTAIDETVHQPIDMQEAPRITGVKIIENPFEGSLKPTSTHLQLPWQAVETTKHIIKAKRQGRLNANVLSFGEEMGDIETWQQASSKTKKKKLNGPALQEDSYNGNKQTTTEKDDGIDVHVSNTAVLSEKTSQVDFSGDNKNDVCATKEESKSEPFVTLNPFEGHTNEAKIKRGTSVSLVEARRAQYLQKKGNVINKKVSQKEREEETLARLAAFQNNVRRSVTERGDVANDTIQDNSLAARMARRAAADAQASSTHQSDNDEEDAAYHGQILDDDEDEGDAKRWLQTKFQCRRHMDHTAGHDRLDDYKVIDSKDTDRGVNDKKERHHHKKHHRHKHHD